MAKLRIRYDPKTGKTSPDPRSTGKLKTTPTSSTGGGGGAGARFKTTGGGTGYASSSVEQIREGGREEEGKVTYQRGGGQPIKPPRRMGEPVGIAIGRLPAHPDVPASEGIKRHYAAQGITTAGQLFSAVRGERREPRGLTAEEYAPEELKGFARRTTATEERWETFTESEGLQRISDVAGYMTLGGGKPYEERSFIGKTAQSSLTGIMSFPIVLGGAIPMAGEKIAGVAEGLYHKETRKQVPKEVFVRAPVEVAKTTFNPTTPEGATTYVTAATFAAIGGGVIAKAKAAKARAKAGVAEPVETGLMKGRVDVIRDEVIKAKAEYEGRVSVGGREFEVVGGLKERGVVTETIGKVTGEKITTTKGVSGVVLEEIRPGFVESELGLRQILPSEKVGTYYGIAKTEGWGVGESGVRKGMVVVKKVTPKGEATMIDVGERFLVDLGKVEQVGKPKPIVEFGRTRVEGESFSSLMSSKKGTVMVEGVKAWEVRGESFTPVETYRSYYDPYLKLEYVKPESTSRVYFDLKKVSAKEPTVFQYTGLSKQLSVKGGDPVPFVSYGYEARTGALPVRLPEFRAETRAGMIAELRGVEKPSGKPKTRTVLTEEGRLIRQAEIDVAFMDKEPEFRVTKQKLITKTETQAQVGRPSVSLEGLGKQTARMIFETETRPPTQTGKPVFGGRGLFFEPKTELGIKGEPALMFTTKFKPEAQRVETTPKLETIPRIITEPRQIIDTSPKIIDKPVIDTEQIITPDVTPDIGFPYTPFMDHPTPPPPSEPPPPRIIFGLPSSGKPYDTSSRKSKGGFSFDPKYFSDVTAGVTKEIGKEPVGMGFGIMPRPITKRRTGKKR